MSVLSKLKDVAEVTTMGAAVAVDPETAGEVLEEVGGEVAEGMADVALDASTDQLVSEEKKG